MKNDSLCNKTKVNESNTIQERDYRVTKTK